MSGRKQENLLKQSAERRERNKSMKTRKEMRAKRKLGYRITVRGSAARPRLAVYRSNTRLSAQLIDDDKKVTLFSASVPGKNAEAAVKLGRDVAEKAKAQKITTVVFDRAGFRYHGVVKAIADSAREGGLIF